jgi:hypothetical protein
MTKVFVGDVGTMIVLDCGINLSSATVLKIRAKVPGGAGFREWTGTLNGTQSVSYQVQEGDLNVGGTWLLQAYVEMPDWKGRGEWATMEVGK